MGEKFNAPDPGAMQSSATGEAGQRSAYMKMQNPAATIGDPDFDMKQSSATGEAGRGGGGVRVATADVDGDGTADVGRPADDPGAGPDAASRNFEKFKNDSPGADAKAVDSYMKLENAKAVDSYMKLENARSDPGAGPDAASSKAGYDVKKQDRI